MALLVANSLAPLATAGSPEYTSLAAALAIAVGVVFLAARLARLGWIADYFPSPCSSATSRASRS